MVQVLEEEKKLILLDLANLKDKVEKIGKEKSKVNLNSVKNFAKYHNGLISINKAKARLDAKMYGMRLNYF